MYGELADWFHLLTPPAEYDFEAEQAKHMLEAHAHGTVRDVLELGSGGGNLASHLSGTWQMTLTDLEPAMLDVSRTINPGAEHVQGDMRTLRLGRTFDAVVVHDAILYMTTEADLQAAIQTAFVHLRPGGAAIFMPDWIRDSYVPRTHQGGVDAAGRSLRYLRWDREIKDDEDSVITDYIIAARDATGEVATYHDAHLMGVFAIAAWLRLLDSVGLRGSQVSGDSGLEVFIGVRPTG
jgi:SAM-dependent methyltransferase